MTNAVAINRHKLRLEKHISEIELVRLCLGNDKQTKNVKEAIALLQMAEDWLREDDERYQESD